ncbi:hypothetical protein [Alicyclobacillus sp. SO9]|uniref:hypothetical protein n=1 Tax=Alicyclobacillus sp. SO9 TaxID=2665646 RepID=UPI0018E82989|nr:hypothetical protein [Alicyclobacillus sp. SO9]QQE79291.1 hypothetical protein GI364_01915 [Alicyclobacillus sp. SO9]
MRELWWFIHIFGISLWFGVTTAVLLMWPSKQSLRNASTQSEVFVRIQTLVSMLTKSSHMGAGLTALGGVVLSFMVHPKSDLASLWLTSMQGLGVAAFIISTLVMTRKGKRLVKQIGPQRIEDRELQVQTANTNSLAIDEQFLGAASGYRGWLWSVFILLLVCLFMAAFKLTF